MALESDPGRDALELFDAYPGLAERLTETIPARRRHEFTVESQSKAFDVRVSPLSKGAERGSVVVVDDITERTEYERRLEERTERLEVLNRVVRHDIRNDMTLILGYVDALEAHTDEDGRRYLEAMQESGDHVVELTRNVRELMETTLEDPDPKPVELAPILRTETTEADASADEAAVRVDGSIPEVQVRADEMLRSVFRNLLKNAIQHNDDPHPNVEVSVDAGEDGVVVSIADDGPGVPDDRKAEIFGKGEMGLESEGTGVGLYLVQTLVEAYGGEVWVEDNDPEGSVFRVALERPDADAPDRQADPWTGRTAAGSDSTW